MKIYKITVMNPGGGQYEKEIVGELVSSDKGRYLFETESEKEFRFPIQFTIIEEQ